MVDRANTVDDVFNEPVLPIKIEDMEPLNIPPHGELAVIHKGLPRRDEGVGAEVFLEDRLSAIDQFDFIWCHTLPSKM